MNDLFIKKACYAPNFELHMQATCYAEGYIYFFGGKKGSKVTKDCSRYNIVTEEWRSLCPMRLGRFDCSACSLSEYKIAVVGGESAKGKILDLVEIFNSRDNSWESCHLKLKEPRKGVCLAQAQKDVLILAGGEGKYGAMQESEELDFLKKSSVQLTGMHVNRARTHSFVANNIVYVFGGMEGVEKAGAPGEKFSIYQNKWETIDTAEKKKKGALGQKEKQVEFQLAECPAALIYE